MRTSRPVAAAAAGALALVLSSCSLFAPEEETEVAEVKVGDCLNISELPEEVEAIPTVPCSQTHEAEIYASTQLSGTDYPGQAAIDDEAVDFCLAQWEGFMGIEWERSELDFSYFFPTESSWTTAGDREVLCVVVDESGIRGTLRDSGR
jgi:hypothetical protein